MTQADLFRRGKQVLGKQAGGLIARLLRVNNRDIHRTLATIERAAQAENPREYIGRVLNPLQETPARLSTLDGGASGEFYRV